MKRKLTLAAILAAAASILLLIFIALRWKDAPLPDDSDLVLPVREVNAAKNPYPGIRFLEFKPEEQAALDRAWQMIEGDAPLDTALVTDLLEKHAESLVSFDNYASMTDWQQDQELAVDTEVHYLYNWSKIAQLKAMEARVRLEVGESERALLNGVVILRFAKGLHQAEGGILHQLVAVLVARIGMVTILEAVESGKLSEPHLARLAELLASPIFRTETFAQAYIVEYQTFRRVADDLAEGKIHIHQLKSYDSEEAGGSAHPPSAFFYKRNQTVKLLADAFRQFIDEASMIRSEAPGQALVDAEKFRESAGGLYFSGNLIGRVLFSIVVPSGEQLNDRFAAGQVRLDLLRVRVALERYRLAQGEWPEDLESLVPEFLERVPVDRMDGRPIRFSRENRVVYSVGNDFRDERGVAPDKTGSLRSDKEIVIELKSGAIAGN